MSSICILYPTTPSRDVPCRGRAFCLTLSILGSKVEGYVDPAVMTAASACIVRGPTIRKIALPWRRRLAAEDNNPELLARKH